ncbi:MAG: hypothetical protein ACFFCQ_13190, partial [Promethearchaeota archaeon]
MVTKAVANGFRALSLLLFGFCYSLVIGWAIDFDALFTIDKVLGLGDYEGMGLQHFFIMAINVLTQQISSVGAAIANVFVIALGEIPILGGFLSHGGTDNNGVNSLANYIRLISEEVLPHATIVEEGEELDAVQVIYGLIEAIAALLILFLLPISFFAGLGFVRDGDTKLVITSFFSMQFILGAAIITDHLSEKLTESLSFNIIEEDTSIIDGLVDLLANPLFILGFILYIYLELSFQTSYALNIIEPMIERETRIQQHLNRIRDFVPEKEEEIKTVEGALGKQASGTAKGYDLLAMSYLREMVEKRVFKKGQPKEDAKVTMRLQSYLENLNQSDLLMEQKLTAKSAQPKTSSLILHLIPMITYRVII